MIEGILVYLIAFFGLYLARILKKIDQDEIREGAKYIIGFNFLTVIAIIIILLSNVEFNLITPFLLLIGALLGHFFYYPYFYLGLSLVASILISDTVLFINATLVFLFGVTYLRRLHNEIICYVFPLILLFISSGLINYADYLTTLAAGTLISVILFGRR